MSTRTKLSEKKIGDLITRQEGGLTVREICKDAGISEATFYNWKAKYLSTHELPSKKQTGNDTERLQKENNFLKEFCMNLIMKQQAPSL